MIPATFRRGKIYNNLGSAQRPRQPATEHLGCPAARVAIDAFTLVGDGVEVVGRVGISERRPCPASVRKPSSDRNLRGSISHDEHRQRADDDLTGRHSVAERDNLARRNALVADAHSALLLGRQDALRVSDNVQPSVVKAVPSGTCGIAFGPRLDQPLI